MPLSAAERQKAYRRRQRRRVAVYRIAGGDDLLQALLVSGRLSEAAALDRDRVERELAEVLREWARRWR